MEPKEKAKELVHEMMNIDSDSEMFDGFIMKEFYAQRASLKAVDENIKMLKTILNESTNIYQSLNTPKKLCIDLLNPLLLFWNEVKQEVELL